MGNSRIYIVDWAKLATWLIPGILRKSKLLAFIKALITPVNDLHTRFLIFQNSSLYRLGITPQVCYLQKALNDKYDIAQRRIYITDGVVKAPVVLYRLEENKPLVLYKKSENRPLVLYKKSETAAFVEDFWVWVPNDIQLNINELAAVITAYKMPSKTFTIKRF